MRKLELIRYYFNLLLLRYISRKKFLIQQYLESFKDSSHEDMLYEIINTIEEFGYCVQMTQE